MTARDVHYVQRPAKNISRKMLCETLRRIEPFAPLTEYHYVGFGSAYFADFVLLHRALAVRNMTSIERDTFNKDRYDNNKPFRCITVTKERK